MCVCVSEHIGKIQFVGGEVERKTQVTKFQFRVENVGLTLSDCGHLGWRLSLGKKIKMLTIQVSLV